MNRDERPDIIEDDRIRSYVRLVEAQRHLHRVFDRSLRRHAGISITWYEALLRLARAPDDQMAITELGRKLELTSGGATRLVDRLEEAGYVERIPCPTDRRISWARLTGAGLEALVTATKVHLDDLDHNLTSQLSGEDMNQLDQVLSRLLP